MALTHEPLLYFQGVGWGEARRDKAICELSLAFLSAKMSITRNLIEFAGRVRWQLKRATRNSHLAKNSFIFHKQAPSDPSNARIRRTRETTSRCPPAPRRPLTLKMPMGRLDFIDRGDMNAQPVITAVKPKKHAL